MAAHPEHPDASKEFRLSDINSPRFWKLTSHQTLIHCTISFGISTVAVLHKSHDPMLSVPSITFRSVPDQTESTGGCSPSNVKPDVNGWVPPGTCGYLSRPYYPSLFAAIVFSAAAAFVIAGYAIRTVRAASCTPRKELAYSSVKLLSTGASLSACLFAAYVLRAVGTRHQQEPAFVALSDTVVLICPMLVFAFDCFVLSKIVKAAGLDISLNDPQTWILSRGFLFATTNILAEQLIASILIVPKRKPTASRGASETAMLGLTLYLAGISIQALMLTYAIILAFISHKRLGGRGFAPNSARLIHGSVHQSLRRSTSYAMLFSLSSISLRTAYRIIELSGLLSGTLLFLAHNEFFFYAFECLPVLAAIGTWAVVDIGTLLNCELSDSSQIRTYKYQQVGEELPDSDTTGLPVATGIS
ncbi:unnamed protein product [Periconia digitata]|uniref:Uncharacterized protein n=1 Tax=Periconia digitata TaxID=1303443 RepID=A0A9W4UBA5_9PLEO|nr:unnamed protein product [Periconia digitata]